MRRWAALSSDRRQALMSFDDPMVVETIKMSLQMLYEKQALMHQMGIRLQGAAQDQFASSSLFTAAFTLSWQVGRARNDPTVMLVDPSLLPVLAMKPSFLERADFVEALRQVLPDFLSPGAASMGRTPAPRARWKDIFAKEPASVAALEQQLVRLVEQALWAMAVDPAYEVQQELERPHVSDPDAWWIEEEEQQRRAEAKRRQKKSKRKKAAPPPTVREHEAESSGLAACSADSPRCSERLQVALSESREEDAEFDDADSHADDSVGTGVFHMAGVAASDAASSAPDVDPTRRFGRGTPPSSPAMRPPQPHSSQLICYIWNQTSQFEQSLERVPSRKLVALGGTPDTTASTPNPSSRCSGAVSRGSWTPAAGPCAIPSISVVVKNTFVDIEGPFEEEEACAEKPTQRTRSMSPSILRHMDNEWRYW